MKIPPKWWPWRTKKPILPTDQPSEDELKYWATSDWIEYQAWLFHHSFLSLSQWQHLRATALAWRSAPRISLVTPVYNTDPTWLQDCIYSVKTQAYPHWQLCLVDDGSTRAETRACLAAMCADEPRILLQWFDQNQGICAATNQGIALADGEYVGFLDHDDRLAPDALFHVAQALREHSGLDIVYTDRDMISPTGHRFMHLFKPDWSPETLLSGNYLFHLLVYRRSLLQSLGGVRTDFEGSQDYDLILRAAELKPTVHHIPRVLYHWRQHEASIALAHGVKAYTYSTGLRALQESLERRGFTVTVSENTELWRGNYQVQFAAPPANTWQWHWLQPDAPLLPQLATAWNQAPASVQALVFLMHGLAEPTQASLTELVAWLQLPQVGFSTARVIDAADRLKHAGLVLRADTEPLLLYADQPRSMAGYMAVTASVRNVSAPHPAAFAMRRTVWQAMHTAPDTAARPLYGYALIDLALRASQHGWRTVYTPAATLLADTWPAANALWPSTDIAPFNAAWDQWLQRGDPYYNPYLTLNLADMGLDLQWPSYAPVFETYETNTSDLAQPNAAPA